MNEQIKECWLKAAREDSSDKWDTQEEFIERFAKLIVYDVLSELANDDSLGSPRIEAIRQLAERYGVATMNERIKELAEQVYGSLHYDDLKFAELIIQECVNVFLGADTKNIQLAMKRMKQHFGIEL
jgi:hypothetical protein